jgi:small subunit ribosomal protein S2
MDEKKDIKETKDVKEVKPKLPLLALNDATLESLLNAGVHFGHQTQRWNPAMRQYIYTSREGIHIIDLVKTIEKLNEAIEAVYTYASRGEVLFVGTKTQAKDLVKEAAVKSKSHFVTNRWPGGLLTNYMVTRKSIKKMNDLIKGFHEGIENRTKKELMVMKKDLERLELLYGGVKMFNKRPAAVIVVDPKKSRIAVREANRMGIPVIAIVDTNSSPEMVDHVIPANDDALHSLELVIKKLADTIELANKGVGPEFAEVNYVEVEESIQNMSKKLEDRKTSNGTAASAEDRGQHRVVRVSREQAKRFAKPAAKKA